MRQEKQFLLDDIQGQIEKADSFVVISYLGLKANDSHTFRRSIAKTGGAVEFVPKRIFGIAAKNQGVQFDLNSLTGHLGLVFAGSDAMDTTKAVYEFKKEHPDAVQVIAGHIDGEVCDADKMTALSKLPGKQEMRAQFVGLLQAPYAQTVSAMNAIVASVVCCLDQKITKENK